MDDLFLAMIANILKDRPHLIPSGPTELPDTTHPDPGRSATEHPDSFDASDHPHLTSDEIPALRAAGIEDAVRSHRNAFGAAHILGMTEREALNVTLSAIRDALNYDLTSDWVRKLVADFVDRLIKSEDTEVAYDLLSVPRRRPGAPAKDTHIRADEASEGYRQWRDLGFDDDQALAVAWMLYHPDKDFELQHSLLAADGLSSAYEQQIKALKTILIRSGAREKMKAGRKGSGTP